MCWLLKSQKVKFILISTFSLGILLQLHSRHCILTFFFLTSYITFLLFDFFQVRDNYQNDLPWFWLFFFSHGGPYYSSVRPRSSVPNLSKRADIKCSMVFYFFPPAGKPCQRGEMICCEAPLWEHQRHILTHTNTRTQTHSLCTNIHWRKRFFSRAEQPSRHLIPTKTPPFSFSVKHLLKNVAPDETTHRWPHCCHATVFPQKGEKPDRRTTPTAPSPRCQNSNWNHRHI